MPITYTVGFNPTNDSVLDWRAFHFDLVEGCCTGLRTLMDCHVIKLYSEDRVLKNGVYHRAVFGIRGDDSNTGCERLFEIDHCPSCGIELTILEVKRG